jgi:hypothetical protein
LRSDSSTLGSGQLHERIANFNVSSNNVDCQTIEL